MYPFRTLVIGLVLCCCDHIQRVHCQSDTDTILEKRCVATSDNPINPQTLLRGLHIRVAMYSGELANCYCDAAYPDTTPQCCTIWSETTQEENCNSNRAEGDSCLTSIQLKNTFWSGFDVALLEMLANLGNFSYTIVNMGNAANDITSSSISYTDLAKQALGYPESAEPSARTPNSTINNTVVPKYDHVLEDNQTVHIIGQGTWRVNLGRAAWAVWSVPVVSEGVQLLAPAAHIQERSLYDSLFLIFSPFTLYLWILLFGIVVAVWVLLLKLARRRKKSLEEISRAELLFYSIASCFGKGGELEHNKANTQAFSIVWIFFCFLVTTIYASNLTAILARPPVVTYPVSSIVEVKEQGKVFCVQKGAANHVFFTSHPDYGEANPKLVIEPKNSVPDQIAKVLQGKVTTSCTGAADACCDVSEVTREDFYQYVKDNPSDRCRMGLVGQSFVKRARGMMTTLKYACIVVGVNALIHSLSNMDCETAKEYDFGDLCDASDLGNAYFPTPAVCETSSIDAVNAIEIRELASAFVVLVVGVFFGAVFSYVGRVYRNAWPVKLFVRSQQSFKKKWHLFNTVENVISTDLAEEKAAASKGSPPTPTASPTVSPTASPTPSTSTSSAFERGVVGSMVGRVRSMLRKASATESPSPQQVAPEDWPLAHQEPSEAPRPTPDGANGGANVDVAVESAVTFDSVVRDAVVRDASERRRLLRMPGHGGVLIPIGD
eukprot:m.42612 g.42612  ORF g.42612 m.42612 type:complete len:720 (-) comp19163_c0_seq1:68-2227(-)